MTINTIAEGVAAARKLRQLCDMRSRTIWKGNALEQAFKTMDVRILGEFQESLATVLQLVEDLGEQEIKISG